MTSKKVLKENMDQLMLQWDVKKHAVWRLLLYYTVPKKKQWEKTKKKSHKNFCKVAFNIIPYPKIISFFICRLYLSLFMITFFIINIHNILLLIKINHHYYFFSFTSTHTHTKTYLYRTDLKKIKKTITNLSWMTKTNFKHFEKSGYRNNSTF